MSKADGGKGKRSRESFSAMSKRGWALHPERINPIKMCALCLYRVGFGYTTIAKLTRTNKKLCRQWAKAAGIERGFIKSKKPLGIFGPRKVSETTKRKREEEKGRRKARKEEEKIKAGYRMRFYRASMQMFFRRAGSEQELKIADAKRVREYQRSYFKRPQIRFIRAMRLRTWKAIKDRGGEKESSFTLELLGCTRRELLSRMESLW